MSDWPKLVVGVRRDGRIGYVAWVRSWKEAEDARVNATLLDRKPVLLGGDKAKAALDAARDQVFWRDYDSIEPWHVGDDEGGSDAND